MDTAATYAAFVSYRHLGPDMAAAKQVQTMLETYRPPRGVAEGKRIGRIFRDTTELPASRALDEAIKSALAESDYLIVILSEHFQKSDWCMEELRTFKRMHGGKIDRILPVLISGEPSDVLPEELLYEERAVIDENGQEHILREAREPICADIRGKNAFARRMKLRTEFLRLAAPMLGCGFDDLYQRHRRRRQRNRALLMAAILAVVVGYAGILLHNYQQIKQKNTELDEKNTKLAETNGMLDSANRQLTEKNEALDTANQTLLEQKRELQLNESRLLTESAQNARENRNYGRALSDAASALPQDRADDRPYYAPAEALLWDLLDKDITLSLAKEIDAGEIIKDCVLSQDGRRCYTIGDSYTLNCFDLTDGSLQWSTILPFKVLSTYYGEMILSERNGCLYFTGPFDDPEQSVIRQAALAVDCGSGEIKWILDGLRADDGRLVLSGDESQLLYQIRSYDLKAPDGQKCLNHCVYLDPKTGNPEKYFSPGCELAAGDVEMVFLPSREGVFSEEDANLFAGVYYEKTEDGYRRHFYLADREREWSEDIYVDLREIKGVIRYMRYLSGAHTLLVVCESEEALCAADILCLDTETGTLLWSAHTPAVDLKLYGARGYWTDHPMFVVPDDDNGLLLLGCQKNIYLYDLTSGALLGENLDKTGEKLFKASLEAFYPAGDGVYCAILSDGSSRLCRVYDDNLTDASTGNSVGALARGSCRVWNGGISSGELTSNTINSRDGKGFVAFVPKDAQNTLCLQWIFRGDTDWPPSKIYSFRARQFQTGMSADYGSRMEHAELQFLLYETLEDRSKQYSYVTVDTRRQELRESVFCTRKDLTESGRVILSSDRGGVLIDDGFGSLQFIDLETGGLSQLYGNDAVVADRYSADANDRQGALFAEGVYTLAEMRRADGAAVAAVCEDDVLHLWVDGTAQPDIPLPEGLIWHSTVDDTSYRSFLTGANGYVIMSALPSSRETYVAKGYWAYSTLDDSWSYIENEVWDRADRPIAAAHQKPLFAVADADLKIRIYDIPSGACRTELAIPVPGTSLRTIGFSQDDSYFYAVTSPFECQLFIYRTEDGALVYSGNYSSSYLESPVSLVEDPVNDRLYILTGASHDLTAYCFDTRTWTMLWMRYDVFAVNTVTSKMLLWDNAGISIQDVPTTAELRYVALDIANNMAEDWPAS